MHKRSFISIAVRFHKQNLLLKGFRMGKNSLIKSTDKKKKKAKPVEEASKKSARKEAVKPAGVELELNSERKSASTEPAPKKTLQELRFEKFEPVTPQPPPQSVPAEKIEHAPAPPIIASADPAEADRIRNVLFTRFSMEDVIAAASQPMPVAVPPPEAATHAEAAPASAPPPVAETPGEAAPAEAPAPEAAVPAPQPTPPSASQTDTEPKPARPATEEIKPVVTTVDSGNEPDPVKRSIAYAAAGFALLLLLLIGASVKNSGNYYLNARDNALEISRGRFSPTGKTLFLVLHDTQPPQTTKAVYTREDIFPLAFNYYLDRADGLLATTGMPDYEGMQNYLNQARKYAISPEMERAVTTRLYSIERMPLLYKADVAISKNTPESLQAALEYLRQAQPLTTDAAQAELVAQRIAEVEARQAALAAAAAAHDQPQAQP